MADETKDNADKVKKTNPDVSDRDDIRSLVEKAGAENLIHVPPGSMTTGGGVPGAGAAKPHQEVDPQHKKPGNPSKG